jgi:hypothetical protein
MYVCYVNARVFQSQQNKKKMLIVGMLCFADDNCIRIYLTNDIKLCLLRDRLSLNLITPSSVYPTELSSN